VFRYQGGELDIFARASHWKNYWGRQIRPWLHGDVLEVGAGIGANTVLLQSRSVRSWHCLEPDPNLSARLSDAVSGLPNCTVATGTTASLPAVQKFDCVLYIDVLEHIEADLEELACAVRLMRPGAHLIVLSPAHQFLYSQFDRAIGHFRRYCEESLKDCAPRECTLESIFYLDSIGILASLANRMLLRKAEPTIREIMLWDNLMVPLSTVVDRLLGRRFGKSIVGIWRR
jgi:SAM-dependent methyltransferase